MKRLNIFCLCMALLASFTQPAFAWGSVSGPNGGSAYRGPMGAGAVHGPNGGSAYRAPGPVYRGGGAYYHPYPAAGVAAGVATGVVVGSAVAATRPPPYYAPPVVVAPPPCGYYPYGPCY
jgi:hypothetical protein